MIETAHWIICCPICIDGFGEVRVSAAGFLPINDPSQSSPSTLGISFFSHHKLPHSLLTPEDKWFIPASGPASRSHFHRRWLPADVSFSRLQILEVKQLPPAWSRSPCIHSIISLCEERGSSTCPLKTSQYYELTLENFIMSSRLVDIDVSLKEGDE